VVNGESKGPLSSLLFWNIAVDQVISVSFKPLPVYSITVTVQGNGTSEPDNTVTVKQGDFQDFVFTPNQDNELADVLVDGVSIGPKPYYLFNDITDNHNLTVQFKEIPKVTVIASKQGNVQLIRSDKENPDTNEEAFAFLRITVMDQDD
jgi:hypothetical protein